jgi:hypothetical protein
MDMQGVSLSAVSSVDVQFLSMPECRTVRHPVSPVPGTEMKKNADGGTRLVPTFSGTWYRAEMPDAGMTMPSYCKKTYLTPLISEERLKQSCNLV